MSIAAKHSLKGLINPTKTLTGNVHISNTFEKELDYYEGSYEIKPTTESQTLPVQNKTMKNDLTIKSIPYAEVTNNANGITVTIGE